MRALIEYVEGVLDIPYLTEEDVLYNGSFCVTPIASTGIRGNGKVRQMNTHSALDLFYTDKIELVENTQALIKALSENGYVCQDPTYSYEKNGNLWRASINIIEIGGNI